ncbi:MAG: hypothetical protein II875_02920 [Clostridia bacterium]|nr:hypothetical protein [Clostridia bacterium]
MRTLIAKGFLLHAVMMIVCLLVSGIGNLYVAVALTFCLYVGYVIFMFAEGAQEGESECAMTDTVKKIRDAGNTPTKEQLAKCFTPMNGIWAFVVLCAPGLILSVLNLITYDPASTQRNLIAIITRFYFLPEIFLTRLCNDLVKTDINGAVQAASFGVTAFRNASLDPDAMIGGFANLSRIFCVVTDNYAPIRLLSILYIPLNFVAPAAMLFGFMKGPKLRAKTLNDMMKGSNKKLRRMRKQRTHVPRSQKPEI